MSLSNNLILKLFLVCGGMDLTSRVLQLTIDLIWAMYWLAMQMKTITKRVHHYINFERSSVSLSNELIKTFLEWGERGIFTPGPACYNLHDRYWYRHSMKLFDLSLAQVLGFTL